MADRVSSSVVYSDNNLNIFSKIDNPAKRVGHFLVCLGSAAYPLINPFRFCRLAYRNTCFTDSNTGLFLCIVNVIAAVELETLCDLAEFLYLSVMLRLISFLVIN